MYICRHGLILLILLTLLRNFPIPVSLFELYEVLKASQEVAIELFYPRIDQKAKFIYDFSVNWKTGPKQRRS